MATKQVTLKSTNPAALQASAEAMKAMGATVLFPVYVVEAKASVGKFEAVSQPEPDFQEFCIDVLVYIKDEE